MLSGRRVLVTGGSSGIGAEIARALARLGARIVVHGRNLERAQAVCASIREDRGEAAITLGDLTDGADVSTVVAQANDAFGGIDILVNNAGGINRTPVESWENISTDAWEDSFRLNVMSSVAVTRALLPAMLDRRWGRIIQISSRSAVAPASHVADYAAAKAALNSFTSTLAASLAGSGVTANTIMPGPVHTLTSFDASAGISTKANSADIAGAAVYLAGSSSSFINGAVLLIDGGFVAA